MRGSLCWPCGRDHHFSKLGRTLCGTDWFAEGVTDFAVTQDPGAGITA